MEIKEKVLSKIKFTNKFNGSFMLPDRVLFDIRVYKMINGNIDKEVSYSIKCELDRSRIVIPYGYKKDCEYIIEWEEIKTCTVLTIHPDDFFREYKECDGSISFTLTDKNENIKLK